MAINTPKSPWAPERLLQNVIWPAVAGNVAWSLMNVFFVVPLSDKDWYWRVLALVTASIYLAADWLYFEQPNNIRGPKAAVFEGVSAMFIAFFALAVGQPTPTGGVALLTTVPVSVFAGAIFSVSFVGLLSGAWTEENKNPKKGYPPLHSNKVLIAWNLVGLVIVGVQLLGTYFGIFVVSAFAASAVALIVVVSGWLWNVYFRHRTRTV